jgi:hypothetical protein
MMTIRNAAIDSQIILMLARDLRTTDPRDEDDAQTGDRLGVMRPPSIASTCRHAAAHRCRGISPYWTVSRASIACCSTGRPLRTACRVFRGDQRHACGVLPARRLDGGNAIFTGTDADVRLDAFARAACARSLGGLAAGLVEIFLVDNESSSRDRPASRVDPKTAKMTVAAVRALAAT